MHRFPVHRPVLFGIAPGYSMVVHWSRIYMLGVCMGPPQIAMTTIGSIRERFEEVETLQRNVLKGIGLNAVLKDLSPEVVPSMDSTDDTLGNNWE